MPEFAPGETKTAIAPITIMPAGLSCEAEVFLGPNDLTKVVSSGRIPFTSTGASQNVHLPVAMPATAGTYHVYIDVFAEGNRILAYQATEDVVIAALGPAIINGGFEHGSSPWVFATNYPGRSALRISSASRLEGHFDTAPYEGNYVLEMNASVGGRHIVMTATQTIPWSDSYRGLPLSISARASRRLDKSFASGTLQCVEIDDGVSISRSPYYTGGIWEELTVSKTLSPYATKLDVVLYCAPAPGAAAGFVVFFDNVRIE